jgi:hypothetical protein
MEDCHRLLVEGLGGGFRPEWKRFFVSRDEPRAHIRLERADLAGDDAEVALLLEGKTERGAAADPALASYLRWHVRQTSPPFEWKALCAAEGCAEFAPFRCGGCRAARYCGRPCQSKDWRARHRSGCCAEKEPPAAAP